MQGFDMLHWIIFLRPLSIYIFICVHACYFSPPLVSTYFNINPIDMV